MGFIFRDTKTNTIRTHIGIVCGNAREHTAIDGDVL